MDESSIIFKRIEIFLWIGLTLLEESDKQKVSPSIADLQPDESVFNVHGQSVMMDAVNVLSILGKSNIAVLRAKGSSIPNAGAVANIITEKMLKGNSNIQKITVDSEFPPGVAKMLSTIEIILQKI